METGGVAPTSAQHRLSDFLYAELLHTLGSYKSASEKLKSLRKDFPGRPEDRPLLNAIARAEDHNKLLRDHLHRPQSRRNGEAPSRHPSPLRLTGEREEEKKDKEEKTKPDPNLLVPVHHFYQVTERALRLHLKAAGEGRDPSGPGEILGSHFARIQDPHRRHAQPSEDLIKGRQERAQYRGQIVDKLQRNEPAITPGRSQLLDPGAPAFNAILNDCLAVSESEEPGQPLHLTALEALGDAHQWMHHAEHLRSQTFGAMLTEIPATHHKMQRLLNRSVVLNTFVYVAARSAPWVFAESEEERAYVSNNFETCCNTMTPTYCMWIGNQMGLLALGRRAYSWWILGRDDLAYCDFFKLIRLLRLLRRQVDRRAMRVPGTRTLIEGLTATAEHHIGRIYRGQHAHRNALRHFDRAASRVEGWETDPEIGKILRNSRWRVNLLISRGKANYELGRMKTSLFYYARAWKAYLQLADSESHPSGNFEVVDNLTKWLEAIRDDPELSKAELSERVEPLVRQFETVLSPLHLRLLAAEIMMRFGHLLYLLKLPPQGWSLPDDPDDLPPAPDHELPRRCMFQAAQLDPASTLIATDLLKIRHGAKETTGDANVEVAGEEILAPVLLKDQWPAGNNRFEEAVSVIEYVIQTWLDEVGRSGNGGEDWPEPQKIARELLRSFLAHTDSSNVKLAQVYRYLMQAPREFAADVGEPAPTIEVVCLRRYSSFFPFLPRPAAFRALGGGYLVQVRDRNPERPFGIAIDPGPDFLDNLYRCGYALSDIHMIVLTHDHADHIASVDALLALMGIRQFLDDDSPFGPGKCLAIVGNESVVRRYRFFNEKHPVKKMKASDGGGEEQGGSASNTDGAERNDFVRVMTFRQFRRVADKRDPNARRKAFEQAEIQPVPSTLRIEPVRTADHLDAMGYPAQGFLLSIGEGKDRSSVFFTGDTGVPPNKDNAERSSGGPYFAAGRKGMANAAASADVVIAHLSSVPLPELRELAGLANGPPGYESSRGALEGLWDEAVATARSDADTDADGETRFLLRQLQFAFRSRGESVDDLDISPFSPVTEIKRQSERHLFLGGLIDLAKEMAKRRPRSERPPLLLIGELREELGTFRTRIASRITEAVFDEGTAGTALTTDIGLRVRVSRRGRQGREKAKISVLCTTCDLDNDLIASERFHPPEKIREVCVKGENEGVFYNCELHDPGRRPELLWVESVERYNVFGE